MNSISIFKYSIHNEIQKIFYLITRFWKCHQIPERSFIINGRQVPLCARCCGIILGLFLSPSSILIFIDFKISILLPLICVIDATTQLYGIRNSNNFLRFSSGILFGCFIPALLLAIWRLLNGI